MNICCSNINQYLAQTNCKSVPLSLPCWLVANQVMLEHISGFPWWEIYILTPSAFTVWSIPHVCTFQTFGFEKLTIYKGIATDLESHYGKAVPYTLPKT